jgi:hypothetical protein
MSVYWDGVIGCCPQQPPNLLRFPGPDWLWSADFEKRALADELSQPRYKIGPGSDPAVSSLIGADTNFSSHAAAWRIGYAVWAGFGK